MPDSGYTKVRLFTSVRYAPTPRFIFLGLLLALKASETPRMASGGACRQRHVRKGCMCWQSTSVRGPFLAIVTRASFEYILDTLTLAALWGLSSHYVPLSVFIILSVVAILTIQICGSLNLVVYPGDKACTFCICLQSLPPVRDGLVVFGAASHTC